MALLLSSATIGGGKSIGCHRGKESRPFRSFALSFVGAKSPQRELSLPWHFRSVEHSLLCNLRPIIKIIIGLSVQPVLLKAAPAAPAPKQAKQSKDV